MSSVTARILATPPARAFWVSRGGLFLVAWIGLALWPVASAPPFWQAFPDQPWLDGWARFDSAWYLDIWTHGYTYRPGEASNVNFFPLYAVVVGSLSLPLRPFLGPERAFYLAAIGLSLVAFRLALGELHRLTLLRLDRGSADRTVWLTALYPFGIYFGAAYTESLYLALAVFAFERAEKNRWGAAAALGAAASLVRVPGFLVLVGLGLEWMTRRRGRWRERASEALFLAAGTLPLLLLLGRYWHRFGTPFPFLHTQLDTWGREIGLGPILGELRAIAAARSLDELPLLHVTYLGLLAVALPLCWVAWRRLGVGYGAFCLLSIALAALSGLPGLGRYLSVLFPLFMVAGLLLRERMGYLAVLAGFVPPLLVATFSFTHWGRVN